MRRVPLILILALALPAFLAGCTTTDNGTGDDDEEPGVIVDMVAGNKYEPKTIEVEVGDQVTWKNLDSQQHTVTPFDSENWGTEGSGDAKSKWMNRGDSYSFTFTEPGTYQYRCIPHSWPDGDGWDGMVGTVNVGEPDDSVDGNETTDGNQTTDGNETA